MSRKTPTRIRVNLEPCSAHRALPGMHCFGCCRLRCPLARRPGEGGGRQTIRTTTLPSVIQTGDIAAILVVHRRREPRRFIRASFQMIFATKPSITCHAPEVPAGDRTCGNSRYLGRSVYLQPASDPRAPSSTRSADGRDVCRTRCSTWARQTKFRNHRMLSAQPSPTMGFPGPNTRSR